MIWLGGSNSHSHTLRWRDVALLIRRLHLYSQLWPHLKTYITAQLYLNVLVTFSSVIPKKFTGDLLGQISYLNLSILKCFSQCKYIYICRFWSECLHCQHVSPTVCAPLHQPPGTMQGRARLQHPSLEQCSVLPTQIWRILSVLQQTFTTLNHTNIVNQGSRKQKGFRNNKKSSFPLFFLSLTSLKGGCKPYFQALLCHQNHKRLRRIYFQKQRHLVKHKLSLRHMTKNSRIGSAAIAFCIEIRKKDSPVKWLLKVSQ